MAVRPIPEGYHTVVPYIIAADAEKLLTFLKAGLNARETEVMRYPDGRIWHGDVVIGDSHVMLSQATEQHPAMASTLYLYVPDTDAAYRAAGVAGDAHGLARAGGGPGGIGNGAVAPPQLDQLGGELGGDVVPDGNDVERHFGYSLYSLG